MAFRGFWGRCVWTVVVGKGGRELLVGFCWLSGDLVGVCGVVGFWGVCGVAGLGGV